MTGETDLTAAMGIEEEHDPSVLRRSYGTAQLVVDVLRVLRKGGVDVSESLEQASDAIKASEALLRALEVEPTQFPVKSLPVALTNLPVRLALARHDLATVYRTLGRVGVTQRRIAAATGQSQSEISEILGGRVVSSYPVLARVAAGLGVPRGHVGLAYDAETLKLLGDHERG